MARLEKSKRAFYFKLKDTFSTRCIRYLDTYILNDKAEHFLFCPHRFRISFAI
ncbi:MAG: hypothetical protein ACJAR1_000417 [Rubritalea sp.]|jgi:hypothetical protein